jgi:hypothetical protein
LSEAGPAAQPEARESGNALRASRKERTRDDDSARDSGAVLEEKDGQ